MKKYSELQGADLEVETPDGCLVGIVSAVQRGQGQERNCIEIEIVTKESPPDGQCWVTFNEKRYGAIFKDVMTASGVFKSKVETIISDEEFWEFMKS